MRALILGGPPPRILVLILSEHVLVVLSVIVAAGIMAGPGAHPPAWLNVTLVSRASLIAATLQLCFHYGDLYELRRSADYRKVFIGLIQAIGAASFILAFLYYLAPGLIIGPGVVMVASGVIVALLSAWRMAFGWFAARLEPTERLLIVGTGGPALVLAQELHERRQELGVELVGFVDPDASLVGTSLINREIIGVIDDIPDIVHRHRVDRVVVSLVDARGKLPMAQLLRIKLTNGVRFDHLASVYETYTGKIAVENLRPSWLIFSNGFRRRRSLAAVKRLIDIGIAGVGLLLFSPLLLLAAIAVRLSSVGPALYHQRRVGRDGRVFTIHKFRSMRTDAEVSTGAVWSTVNDPRVTSVGRILRRSRIDELPQLWNVLCGDMSFVGPRPERPEFVSELTEQIPFYGQRHVVRPGLTGWAQVRHEYGSTVDDAMQKLQYELFYIKHVSIAFDVFILFETIKTVLVRRGS